ncbi:hypothetical protein ACFQW6_03510 [Nocardioides sp. GCM10028917]|uniref:hypothetical protein n=1 Tax=Nocardioides sp. GCM10028917 TaxID=3273408 RepID=UPI00360B048E
MIEPHQWTFIELRGDASGPPTMSRWFPEVAAGEEVLTRVGHCLVVREVDWVGDADHRATFMLQHWDGVNESTQSPLLYAPDSAAGGSWRSQQGALVPLGRVLYTRIALGSIILIRGYWLQEQALADLQLAPAERGTQVEMRLPPPDFKL